MITDQGHIAEIRSLFDRALSDEVPRWELGPDGVWTRRHCDAEGRPLADLQATLIDIHAKRRRKARRR